MQDVVLFLLIPVSNAFLSGFARLIEKLHFAKDCKLGLFDIPNISAVWKGECWCADYYMLRIVDAVHCNGCNLHMLALNLFNSPLYYFSYETVYCD